MVYGKPFWDRVGREGGIMGILQRIIGALQSSWDRGWPGSEGAKDHWTIVFFCVKILPGSLDHWIIGANWNYLHITNLYWIVVQLLTYQLPQV